jgi:hypothetical protein
MNLRTWSLKIFRSLMKKQSFPKINNGFKTSLEQCIETGLRAQEIWWKKLSKKNVFYFSKILINIRPLFYLTNKLTVHSQCFVFVLIFNKTWAAIRIGAEMGVIFFSKMSSILRKIFFKPQSRSLFSRVFTPLKFRHLETFIWLSSKIAANPLSPLWWVFAVFTLPKQEKFTKVWTGDI